MYKNLILIFISISILYFSIEDFGFMFLSIPTFLILSYNLSDFVLKIVKKKEMKKTKEKNLEFISMIGVGSIFFVLRDFEQTIGGYELFWKLSFFSLIISIFCVFILSRFYNLNNEKKFYNILSISICFFLLVPNIGIFINKYINKEKERKQEIEINYKYINPGSRGSETYEIFIKTDFDKNERLDIKKEFYESISNNQIVVLTLSKGILGYNYVKKIEKIEN
jgi:hypothetical protein